MDEFDEKFAALLQAWEAGNGAPAALIGQLSDDEAYRSQVRMLGRRLAAGEQHAGWKIGQTNRQMRRERGETQPAPGFLLESDRRDDGCTVDLQGAPDWHMEPELALLLCTDLHGPGVDREQVQAAIGAVAPAIELVRPKSTWPDRALLRAVNGATSGFILGPPMTVQPTGEELDHMQVELAQDGATRNTVRAGDVNDNPLDSVSWLANYLTTLGQPLRAGQTVLAGSYAGLVPMVAGQHWRAVLGDYGAVVFRTA